MYPYLGKVRPGATLFVPFHTFDSNDPSASVTITGLATTDIEVYKDASMTQRASDSGYALVDTDGIDIDTTTGIHGVTIDLSDNTTAGFWAAGSDYVVVIASITVDAATINFIPVRFSIGYPNSLYDTTIATLSTQTSFTLTNGPAEDDALNGMWVAIHDVASSVQVGHAVISDYTGSTKTVTLAAATTFTVAATDNISIIGPAPLQPTTAGNTLDVTATGAAGIDWGNIENKTTANDLSGTDIQLCDTITTYTGNTVQTGDSFARLGAPAGVSVSADIATVDSNVDAILVDTGTTLDTHLTDIKGATFNGSTDSLEAIRDRGDSAWATGAGGSDRLLMVDTTIATLSTQTSFTLTAGSADDDSYNNCTIIVEDVSTSTQKAVGMVLDYTGSTKTVTLKEALAFTIATTDKVYILAENSLKSTVANRQLDVTATGAAGIDWGNVENPTTALDLSGTDIQLCDTTTTVTNQVTANVTAVSGDSAAADNLEADYDGTGYTKTSSTIGTCTTNTDMRGTDSAALASNYTAARAGYLDNINGHTAQTGDSFARLGAPAGASVSADIATVDSNVDAVLVDTGTTLPASISALNDVSVADILTTQMTEAYASDGTAPTLAQALFLIQQSIGDFAISGTTVTVKKLDGSTTAATYTLDDGTSPTSRTRST